MIFKRTHKPGKSPSPFWIVLILIVPNFFLSAQLTNEEVYTAQTLEIALPLARENPIKSLSGTLTSAHREKIPVDTTVHGKELAFYLEEIRYKSLGNGKFARYLQGSVNLADTTEQVFEFTYSDTLSRREVARSRKAKINQLKGDNPLFVNKVMVPFAAVAVGVGTIFALFYIRTQ